MNLASDNESTEQEVDERANDPKCDAATGNEKSEELSSEERSEKEEIQEEYLKEIDENLRSGHYRDYYYQMPPYFNHHTFKEARRQGKCFE